MYIISHREGITQNKLNEENIMINPLIAKLAADEALNYMVGLSGGKFSEQDIMEAIVNDPESETAKFFNKHLIAGYKAIEALI